MRPAVRAEFEKNLMLEGCTVRYVSSRVGFDVEDMLSKLNAIRRRKVIDIALRDELLSQLKKLKEFFEKEGANRHLINWVVKMERMVSSRKAGKKVELDSPRRSYLDRYAAVRKFGKLLRKEVGKVVYISRGLPGAPVKKDAVLLMKHRGMKLMRDGKDPSRYYLVGQSYIVTSSGEVFAFGERILGEWIVERSDKNTGAGRKRAR